MSMRIHTADAAPLNLSVFRPGEARYDDYDDEAFDFDQPIVILEDALNQEAWVIVGSDDDLKDLARDIASRVTESMQQDE